MHFILPFTVLLGSLFATPSFVSALNIYEQPTTNSKIVTSIPSGSQLIPIFAPDKEEWIKVANPQNGDVGWAQASELKGPTIITKVNGTKTQQIIINNEGKKKEPMVYRVIQYSRPNKLKPEEAEKVIKDMEKYNDKMRASMQKTQEEMHKLMQEMFKNFDKDFYTFPAL